MAHPPRTSAALAPLAAAAYVLPLFFLPGGVGAGLTSAAITIPVCVLVGEGIAWGVGRLEQIELALARERDRAEQLRELDQMKDQFLSAVSHELRTPITICRGHLEVLEDRADEREVRAVKAMCVSELALMGRLVEDLATLAWADDGRALVNVEALPLDDFLHDMAAKAGAILEERVRVVSGHRWRDAAGGPPAAGPGPGEPAAERGRPRQRGRAGLPSGGSRALQLAV
jgi:signal transduction histidine kinase